MSLLNTGLWFSPKSLLWSRSVFSEDLPDKLPPTHDIQHAIELVSGAKLDDLLHHRIDYIKHIKLERQVDELSLEIKQQCTVPINTYVYKDKFYSYVVSKDVSQIKDVTIYSWAMSDNSMNAVMREYNIIQIINFSSLIVKLRVAFHHILLV